MEHYFTIKCCIDRTASFSKWSGFWSEAVCEWLKQIELAILAFMQLPTPCRYGVMMIKRPQGSMILLHHNITPGDVHPCPNWVNLHTDLCRTKIRSTMSFRFLRLAIRDLHNTKIYHCVLWRILQQTTV